jgi:large subunit ribosomal protein L23
MRDPRDILLRPVVTEKSLSLLQDNKYTFLVDPRANKTEIKNAVEKLFKVKVLKVNTMRYKGKPRRVRQFAGYTPRFKKAVVTLRPGDKIEIYQGM